MMTADQQEESFKEKKERFTERAMARVVVRYLQNRGYKATCELVVNEHQLEIRKLTDKEMTKVRIDIAAHKNGKIIFIEIENGLWLSHPLLYRQFAHRLFLGFPKGYASPVDAEQLELARVYGIGVVAVDKTGELELLLAARDYPIAKKTAATIIKLIDNKRRKEKEKRDYSAVFK